MELKALLHSTFLLASTVSEQLLLVYIKIKFLTNWSVFPNTVTINSVKLDMELHCYMYHQFLCADMKRVVVHTYEVYAVSSSSSSNF